MKLTWREESVLREIMKYTRTPGKSRMGYSKHWTTKTNDKLAGKGLVEFSGESVVITDDGIKVIRNETQA